MKPLKTAIENWRKINDTDLAALNAVLSKSGRGVCGRAADRTGLSGRARRAQALMTATA